MQTEPRQMDVLALAYLGDAIYELSCNVDDMTAEEIGFATERLFEGGARDVYTQAIGMKKSRPGVMLSVVCLPEDADRLTQMLAERQGSFEHNETAQSGLPPQLRGGGFRMGPIFGGMFKSGRKIAQIILKDLGK